MTTDNPESIRCPECHATSDQPCHNLNQMITIGGVTRRAVTRGPVRGESATRGAGGVLAVGG